jgi:Immunity protein 50
MWSQYLQNKEALEKTYGKLSVNPFVVRRVKLNDNLPALTIEADLPEFPESPPKKWIEWKANVVQIELDFTFCEEILIKNFKCENTAILEVCKLKENFFEFHLHNDKGFLIKGTCVSIYLQKISAYQQNFKIN